MAEISSGVCEGNVNFVTRENRLYTYEVLELVLVLDLNHRLPALVDDLEGPVLHVTLELGVLELASDETLRVENGLRRCGVESGLGSVSDAN